MDGKKAFVKAKKKRKWIIIFASLSLVGSLSITLPLLYYQSGGKERLNKLKLVQDQYHAIFVDKIYKDVKTELYTDEALTLVSDIFDNYQKHSANLPKYSQKFDYQISDKTIVIIDQNFTTLPTSFYALWSKMILFKFNQEKIVNILWKK